MRAALLVSISCLAFVIGSVFSSVTFSYSLILIGFVALISLCVAVFPRWVAVFFCIGFGFIYGHYHAVGWLQNIAVYNHEVEYVDTVATVHSWERQITKAYAVVDVLETDGRVYRLRLSTGLFPRLKPGDQIRIQGRVRIPEAFAYTDEYGFDRVFAYDKWLLMRSIGGVMYYPQISIIGFDTQYRFKRILFDIKEYGINQIAKTMPRAESSLLAGIVFGDQYRIATPITESFKASGLTHLVALSGYNITIIAVAFFWIMPYLGVPRQWAVWLVLGGIGIFVIMVGAQASIVRAAIMGGIAVIAYSVGRPARALPALIISAAVMTWFQPLTVMYDAGFQLSFVATAGLLLGYDRVYSLVTWVPEYGGLRDVIAGTLVASIATTPVQLYSFGTISPFALFANVVVIPASSLVMLGAIVVLVASFLPGLLQTMLVVPVWILLRYMVMVAEFFAEMHYAKIGLPNISVYTVWGMYGVLLVLIFWYHTNTITMLWRRLISKKEL